MTVTGKLPHEGWGVEMGFPGSDLDEGGEEIQGYLFSSDLLPDYWTILDEFEGEAYERVVTEVKLADKRTAEAYIYKLNRK